MLQLPLKSKNSFNLLELFRYALFKIFPGMMFPVDHSEVTVTLLGEKKTIAAKCT